jgi:diphthine-ammonia ligase
MRVGVLYSGGKDSNYALYKATLEHEVRCLITVEPYAEDSMLFHYPNTWLTRLQADAIGLPHIYVKVSKGQDERMALREAILQAKSQFEIEGVVTGGVKSVYQSSLFTKELETVGLEPINPLWGINETSYLYSLLRDGFVFMMTSVSALGLGKSWLGKIMDLNAVNDLIELSKEHMFNPSLEGGEGETLVLDMPLFSAKLVILETEVVWDGYRGLLKIKSASLREKDNVVR